MFALWIEGGKKQRDLQWGDIESKIDLNKKEYLEYSVERQTKTRPGDNPANRRAVKPRTFENKAVGPERDPVFVYKLYRSKTVLYIINRKIHGCLEIPHLFLVLNMISHLFAALNRKISCSTLEINVVFPRTHVLFSIY